jgi:stage II sporulation protein D
MPGRTLALLALLALAVPAAASADLRIDGRGFGHGIGLSQYGAYGYAEREGRAFDWILGHYYSGTELRRTRARSVRVLLRRASSQTVCGASLARGADGRRARLSESRAYRLSRSGGGRLRLSDVSSRRTLARLSAPVRISGGRDVCLRGRADNGATDGRYRGTLTIIRDGSRVIAVNRLALEHYLYGVVPDEMPTSWPIEALKAQAVAARTYALKRLRDEGDFDLFADVRSQVYGGLNAEEARGTEAVQRTRGLAVTYQGTLADTFFHSTSGGRTAAIDEVWDAAPVPYLQSVEDPHDNISPVHTWSVSFRREDAERRLGDLVLGQLQELLVTERTVNGRVRTAEIRGSGGVRTATGGQLRARLGLRSDWFTPAGP